MEVYINIGYIDIIIVIYCGRIMDFHGSMHFFLPLTEHKTMAMDVIFQLVKVKLRTPTRRVKRRRRKKKKREEKEKKKRKKGEEKKHTCFCRTRKIKRWLCQIQEPVPHNSTFNVISKTSGHVLHDAKCRSKHGLL